MNSPPWKGGAGGGSSFASRPSETRPSGKRVITPLPSREGLGEGLLLLYALYDCDCKSASMRQD